MGRSLDIKINNRAFNLLEQLPIAMQGRVAAKAVTAAAREVRRVLKAKLPDSRKTGSRDKWSKATAKKYSGYKPIKQSIKVYNRFRKGTVGASVWVPGLAWMEYGFENKLWGKAKTPMKIPANPVFRPAIDSSRRAQQTAIVKVLVRELRKMAAKA
jgi:hypothetical protein